MSDFYIVARPSTTDLLRNQFPHNNLFSRLTVTTSLEEAMSASQLNTPEQSPFEDSLSHLHLPQAMVIYHAQGELQPPLVTAKPGKPQKTSSSIFDVLKIKTIDVMISDDPLHPAEAKKDKNVNDVVTHINHTLWNRVRHLEEYTQAVNIYPNTPPEAWQIWFQNVAAAENGKAWHVPGSAASYFQMYYALSPFKNDTERNAQFATAKTANYLAGTPVQSGFQPLVLRALEDAAMLATKNVSALYGHQMPPHDYEREILQYTMPLIQKIHPGDREAFVKGVQTTGEIWHGIPAEEIFKEACHGFLRNHPGYNKEFTETMQSILDTMHSPVPMMVYGYWEGAMQQKYECGINSDIQKAFQEAYSKSQAFSEMRRIGEAIDAAQNAVAKQGYALFDLPTGMEVAQSFTSAHLNTGMYPPVCYAWIPDDIRDQAESVFAEQAVHRESSFAMTYALATSMAQCDKTHNSAQMMRDISTIMNEVTMQVARAGVDPRDISALMNEAFQHAGVDDVSDDFEEHN